MNTCRHKFHSSHLRRSRYHSFQHVEEFNQRQERRLKRKIKQLVEMLKLDAKMQRDSFSLSSDLSDSSSEYSDYSPSEDGSGSEDEVRTVPWTKVLRQRLKPSSEEVFKKIKNFLEMNKSPRGFYYCPACLFEVGERTTFMSLGGASQHLTSRHESNSILKAIAALKSKPKPKRKSVPKRVSKSTLDPAPKFGTKIQKASTSSEIFQEDPTSSKIIQEDPISSEIIQEAPTSPEIFQEDPKSPEIIQEDPTSPEIIQEDPTSPEIIQEDPKSPEIIQEVQIPSEIIQEAQTSPEIIQEAPTSYEIIQEDPTSPEIIQEDPTSPEIIQEVQISSEIIQEDLTSPETIQEALSPPEIVQEAPTSTEIIQEAPTSYEIIQEDPTSPEIIQEDPTSPEIIQEVQIPSETIHEAPTSPEIIQEAIASISEVPKLTKFPNSTLEAHKSIEIPKSLFTSSNFTLEAAKSIEVTKSILETPHSVDGRKTGYDDDDDAPKLIKEIRGRTVIRPIEHPNLSPGGFEEISCHKFRVIFCSFCHEQQASIGALGVHLLQIHNIDVKKESPRIIPSTARDDEIRKENLTRMLKALEEKVQEINSTIAVENDRVGEDSSDNKESDDEGERWDPNEKAVDPLPQVQKLNPTKTQFVIRDAKSLNIFTNLCINVPGVRDHLKTHKSCEPDGRLICPHCPSEKCHLPNKPWNFMRHLISIHKDSDLIPLPFRRQSSQRRSRSKKRKRRTSSKVNEDSDEELNPEEEFSF